MQSDIHAILLYALNYYVRIATETTKCFSIILLYSKNDPKIYKNQI